MADIGSPFRDLRFPFAQLRELIRWKRRRVVAWRMRGRFTCGKAVSFARGADVRAPHSVAFGHHVSIGRNFVCEADLIWATMC